MTNEEKQLLLKDLCGRLPYGVRVETKNGQEFLIEIEYGESFIDDDTIGKTPQFTTEEFGGRRLLHDIEEIKPYLRPMSSMTEEEKYIYRHMLGATLNSEGESIMFVYEEDFSTVLDWLNAHLFDYRGLIPMGIALEAPEGMYEF